MTGNVSIAIKRDISQKTVGLGKNCMNKLKLPSMKCFKCCEHGYIAKFCRKHQKPEKDFVSQCRRTTQKISQNLIEELNLEEKEEEKEEEGEEEEEEEEEEKIFSSFQT